MEVARSKTRSIMMYKITEHSNLYTPQISKLAIMMAYARETTIAAVHGIEAHELDQLIHPDGNSIGALLWHIAAIEFGFQVEIFEGRKPNDRESKEWGAAYELGDKARASIKGYDLDFYLHKLKRIRQRTLIEFSKKTDNWLYEERNWDGHLSNNYFIWFHVFEDEINHRGQIRIIRKMLNDKNNIL